MDLQQAVESVRARSKRERPRSKVNIPLPINDGLWVGEFGLVDKDVIDQVGEVSEDDVTGSIALLANFIAAACRRVRMKDGAKLVDVNDPEMGGPARLSESFADAMGLELPERSAAGVVMACFTLDDGTLGEEMLAGFAFALRVWMTDTTKPVDGEILGESPAGPQ